MFRSWFRISSLAILLITSVIAPSWVGASAVPAVISLGQFDSDGLDAPLRLAVDGSGNLYVADARAVAIYKFDRYGRKLKVFKVDGFTPAGIAVTADGSRIYVSGKASVQVLDGGTGAVLGSLGVGVLTQTGAIALDESGFIFVADTGKLRVVVFDPAGTQQYTFGSRGTAAGQFGDISALSINTQRREVLVADSFANYDTVNPALAGVSVFSYDGTFKRKLLATTGMGTVAVVQFSGIAVDGQGRIYLPDSYSGSLRILASDYLYLSRYEKPGLAVGQLAMPRDVVFDGVTSRLFVANGPGRVEVFGIDGAQNPVYVNHAPAAPVALSPVAGSEVATNRPTLAWQKAVDPDEDALLSYNVVWTRGDVTTRATGVTGTSYQPLVDLEENQTYTWAVQASDGVATSVFGELQNFLVNATQEAPAAPQLNLPAEKAVVTGGVSFSWQAASDPDPGDVVGYKVQIAADKQFATLVIEARTDLLTVVLNGLEGYPALVDGQTYFWRVAAIDNHGLSATSALRSFVFDTTVLKVTANIPGATVSLAGNHAYAGRFLGVAPVELRDMSAGTVSVVVERAGFEPWVGQVNLAEQQNVVVHAVLVPARVPAALKSAALRVSKNKARIALSKDAALFAVDYDHDGLTDLLASDARGVLTLYRGLPAAKGASPEFAAGVKLVDLPAGAVPFVVDWNNDGKQDLLLGTGDGSVLVAYNHGSEDQPQFAEPVRLLAGNAPIAVAASASPVVSDLNGDDKKDLVVASSDGKILGYLNEGTDAEPLLAAGTALLPAFSGRVAVTPVDWNADGERDLLVVNGHKVFVCLQTAEGFAAPVEVKLSGLRVADSLVSVAALDIDGQGGKDLFLGSEGGEVVLARSSGTKLVASFASTMLASVDSVAGVAQSAGVTLPAYVQKLRTALKSGDVPAARRIATTAPRSAKTGDPGVDGLLLELVRVLR